MSVVIPLYNKRSTIGRSLASVLAQTFGDFEVIVVDDGSQDDGADYVAAQFADPRVRLHRQANAGPGAARNAGLTLSRGPFITFLDADDDWRPVLLETAVAELAAHPECAVFTAAYLREPEGVDRWAELYARGFAEGPWRLLPAIPPAELLDCVAAFHACTAVYRRETVARYGGFYAKDRCTLGEDSYLWIQILLNDPIYRHMTPLGRYHMEDSELGIGARGRNLPLEPALTDPGPIRAVCPPDLRGVLELWFAQQAARTAFMQLARGDADKAAWLVKAFPAVRGLGLDYLKLRLRLMNPGLWSGLKRLAGR
ncbi:MAG: glycosyltransferase family 2 protein [Phenylobacterium sp.]|nr:MAG: glycosyltransferase family 2 protein [Phenylobacterium sp.]